MRIIKKAILIGIISIVWCFLNIWYAQTTQSWFWYNWYVEWYQVPRAWQWEFSDNNDELLNVIQRVINRVLWMLSLIALVLCLRWGFQMLTAWSDDSKVKSWGKILKNAALWLAIVWISWLVVSFVFRIVNKVTETQ